MKNPKNEILRAVERRVSSTVSVHAGALFRGRDGILSIALALGKAKVMQDDNLADYLLGTPLLGDYLEESYKQLGFSCVGFELDRF